MIRDVKLDMWGIPKLRHEVSPLCALLIGPGQRHLEHEGAFPNMARMGSKQVHVLLSLLLMLICVSAANKYSKHVNKNNEASRKKYEAKDELFKKKLPQMYEERPFRILKVQLLWEKAKKVYTFSMGIHELCVLHTNNTQNNRLISPVNDYFAGQKFKNFVLVTNSY